jgi:hypothetical protein
MRTCIASAIPARLAAGNADIASLAIKKKEHQELIKTHNYVEMNLINFGTGVRKTREGYVSLPNVVAAVDVGVASVVAVM